MVTDFLFTVPSGEPVSVEPFHYAIVGQTQFSGKTTLIKRLSRWAVDRGLKVLIFDTKETVEDYSGFGREIPVCLRENPGPHNRDQAHARPNPRDPRKIRQRRHNEAQAGPLDPCTQAAARCPTGLCSAVRCSRAHRP